MRIHPRFPGPLALALLAITPTPAAAQTVSGPATVIDGASLDLTGTRLRLYGIDAPARKQTCDRNGQSWPCGVEAADILGRLVQGEAVDCVGVGQGSDGKLVARCTVNGIDLAHNMVTAGLAVATPEGQGEYAPAEQRARQYKQGLWAATFVPPAEWRAAHPEAAVKPKAAAAAASRGPLAKPRIFRNAFGCTIKGNRSYRGIWIYHLPGTEYYEQTRAEEFFCTEALAKAAGYRPAMYKDF